MKRRGNPKFPTDTQNPNTQEKPKTREHAPNSPRPHTRTCLESSVCGGVGLPRSCQHTEATRGQVGSAGDFRQQFTTDTSPRRLQPNSRVFLESALSLRIIFQRNLRAPPGFRDRSEPSTRIFVHEMLKRELAFVGVLHGVSDLVFARASSSGGLVVHAGELKVPSSLTLTTPRRPNEKREGGNRRNAI